MACMRVIRVGICFFDCRLLGLGFFVGEFFESGHLLLLAEQRKESSIHPSPPRDRNATRRKQSIDEIMKRRIEN
jgi:hypothetical protein